MKKLKSTLLILNIFLLLSQGNTQQKYYKSTVALEMAKKADMPVIGFFITKNCELCDSLMTILDRNKEIQSFINLNFVPTVIRESNSTTPILDKYAIETFPYVVIFKSNGDQIFGFKGGNNQEYIMNKLQEARDKYLGYLHYRMDLDTVTTIESFVNLSLDYINFNVKDNITGIYNEAMKYNPTLRRIIFSHNAELLDYENIYSLFLDDPDKFTKDDRLRDLMVYAYYNKNKKVLNKKNTNDLITRFGAAGFNNLEETMSYVKIKVANEEFETMVKRGLLSGFDLLPLDLIKDFVLSYPHCPDKEMLSISLKNLVLQGSTKSFYTKLLERVQTKEKEQPDNYMLQDIKSVCLYFLGYKENAMKTVGKANELAFKSNQKYKPSLKAISKN